MHEKEVKNLKKYFFWGVVIILIILSFVIIKPFIISLISAFILAYLIKPIHNYFSMRIGNKLSAFLSVIIIILIIIIPLGIIIGGVIAQTSDFLKINDFKTILEKVAYIPLIQQLDLDLFLITEKAISIMISLFTKHISDFITTIISLLIALLAVYYILINWNSLSSILERYIPFENKKKIKNEMAQITNVIIHGTIFIAIIEFIIGFIGFYISGVKSYLFFPLIISFLAFIPGLGPGIVWIPLAIYYILTKKIIVAIGIIVTGLIISVLIDAILRAKILGDKIKINPLIMLVGILGGIPVFGIFGFIIGPLILIYTIEILQNVMAD